MLDANTALVTGGAGFIGSHLVDALLSEGASVKVFDDFSAGNKVNLQDAIRKHPKKLKIIKGDVRSLRALSNALRDVEIVYHLAAACQWATLEDPVLAHGVNAEGTLNLCRAVRRSNPKLFVHVSSSEVYGDATRPAIDENHPIRPKTPYAASKVAAEAYVNAFQKTYDLPSVILRPFNTFGPRQRGFKRHESDRYGGMVSKSVYAALHGAQIVIYGDGKQTRDYMFVKDCVKGMLAASQEGLRGQIMNLGSGRAISMAQIVEEVAQATGNTELKVTYKPERPGDVRSQLGDISLARRLIGFKPEYDFAQGLQEYIQWAKNIV